MKNFVLEWSRAPLNCFSPAELLRSRSVSHYIPFRLSRTGSMTFTDLKRNRPSGSGHRLNVVRTRPYTTERVVCLSKCPQTVLIVQLQQHIACSDITQFSLLLVTESLLQLTDFPLCSLQSNMDVDSSAAARRHPHTSTWPSLWQPSTSSQHFKVQQVGGDCDSETSAG